MESRADAVVLWWPTVVQNTLTAYAAVRQWFFTSKATLAMVIS